MEKKNKVLEMSISLNEDHMAFLEFFSNEEPYSVKYFGSFENKLLHFNATSLRLGIDEPSALKCSKCI